MLPPIDLNACARFAANHTAKHHRQEREELLKPQQQQQQAGAGAGGDDDVIVEYVTAPVDLTAIFGDAAAQQQQQAEGQDGDGGGSGDEDGGGELHPGLGGGGDAAGAAGDGEQQQQRRRRQQGPLDHFEAFKAVLERFAPAAEEPGDGDAAGADDEEQQQQQEAAAAKPAASDADSDDGDADGAGGAAAGGPKLTKKQRKALQLARIAELKQATPRPDVVEVWDVTAPDPHLLVHLKAARNTVPVPRHWSQKRRYLQGKRGIEKPPFQLPAFIEATGAL